MPIELKASILARELEKHKKDSHLSGKIAGLAINFLEKYFGTNLLLDIPPTLREINPKLFGAIKITERLQKLRIIKDIEKLPKFSDEPFFHRFFITTQKTSNTGSGSDFFSEESAFWKAIGEATERDIWATENETLKNIEYLPYEKIKHKSLNIFDLAGFSEEQKRLIPDLKFNESTIFGWIKAISLSKNSQEKRIYCPAQLISAYYYWKKTAKDAPEKEPILRKCITTGVATSSGILEEAIVKGILEIIERDAYIIAYLNKISPPVIDFENLSYQDEELEHIYKMFKRYRLEVYLVKLPTDFSVSVVSAIIIDRSGVGPALTVGNSANLNLKSAILSALAEALSIRLSLKKNWESKKNITLPDLKKFKKLDRMVYWAKPENFSRLEFMIQGEKIQIDLETEGNFFAETKKTKDEQYYKDKLQLLLKELDDKDYETCYVELSTLAVKKLGLRIVQVVIPKLQPLHLEEEFPCVGGKRLQEVPKALGYVPAEALNQEPHPFG